MSPSAPEHTTTELPPSIIVQEEADHDGDANDVEDESEEGSDGTDNEIDAYIAESRLHLIAARETIAIQNARLSELASLVTEFAALKD